jgi:hypothetical protein
LRNVLTPPRQSFASRERYVAFRRDVTEHLKDETGTTTIFRKRMVWQSNFLMGCTAQIAFDPLKKID